MNRTARILIALLAVSGSPGSILRAVDYYVGPLGDDTSGDGSAANPWRTVTHALTVAGSGDRVLIQPGTYDPAVGEVFPIFLPDGVSLLGPPLGTGTATLRIQGILAPLFAVGDLLETTLIQDLDLEGVGILVQVFGNPADFQIRSCGFLGGIRAVSRDGPGGPASLLMESNTLTQQDETGILWRAFGAPGGLHHIVLRNNTIVGKSFSSDGVAISVSNSLTASVEITGNLVQDWDRHALHFSLGATPSGVTEVRGLIEANELKNSKKDGIRIDIESAGIPPSRTTFSPMMRFNSIKRNNGHGVEVNLTATGTGNLAEFLSPIHGNMIRNNRRSGLLMDSRENLGGQCDAIPDLGGSALGDGRNVFYGNDDGYITGAEFDVKVFSGDAITARGNWWDDPSASFVLTAAMIEGHVFHEVDDPSKGRLDFGGFFGPSLGFTPSPVAVGNASGAPISLVAKPGSAFVPRAGLDLLLIAVDGIPVNPLLVTVSADGGVARFPLPLLRGLAGGTVVVTARNPGEQEGFTTLGLRGDSQGGGFCFIATAAYGDVDAPEVLAFRRFRDECLQTTLPGRALVRAYYRLSPPAAEAIRSRPLARAAVRAVLTPLLGAALLWQRHSTLLLLGLGLLLAARLLRRGR